MAPYSGAISIFASLKNSRPGVALGRNWTNAQACAIVRADLTAQGSAMGLVSDLFTWWNGTTIGTRVYTALVGRLVGTDEFGNHYYQNRHGRRWVTYNGYAEASAIPPGWFGWMHRIVDEPPSAGSYQPHEWEKPHVPNPTGTHAAYRPQGSLYFPAPKPPPSDYEPWQPQ
jgi:NADH:ubiquinone oxidoreductase subunit